MVGSSDDPQPKPAPSSAVASDRNRTPMAEPDSRDVVPPLTRSAIDSLPQGTDKHSEKRWKKVREKLRKQDYDGAIRELEKLLDKSPNDAQARELLAQLRAQRTDPTHRHDDDD